MLTFYYDDYRVHIHDTGRVEYVRFDDVVGSMTLWVVVNDPPAAVMAVAAAVLPLVLSDVMKADLKVAQLREELRVAEIALNHAERCQCAADDAYDDCDATLVNVAAQLRGAEGALQLARVSAMS